MAIEMYVLYNKVTGVVQGSARCDREVDAKILEETQDGSTFTEQLASTMAKNSDLDVIYMDSMSPRLPTTRTHKVDKGLLVELTTEEKVVVEQPFIDEKKIEEEVEAITRATAIQNLKDRGELPLDFTTTIKER